MLPAYLAARLQKQRQAEESAEFARQLPLYADEIAYRTDPPPDDADAPRKEPDWATNY